MTDAELKEDWGWQPGEDVPDADDARGGRVTAPFVYLPHSCDRWIIGGRAEIEQMIADLQALLAVLP